MKEPKLYFLLKHLSKEEFRRLRKAVKSPIYTTNPKVIALFESIRGQYPNFKNTSAMRAKLYAEVFPLVRYNDQKLRRVFTDLTKVVEQFYVHLELEKQQFKKEKLLTEAYGNRNMFDFFERRTNDLLEDLENQEFKNSEYFLKRMSLLKDLYSHPQHNKYDNNDEILEAFSESLDGFFSLSKMQAGVALKNRMKILKRDYRLRFLGAVEKERAEGFLAYNSVFQLYGLAVQLTENPSQEVFEQYELKLFEEIEFLDVYDQKSLFYNGLNFAVRQYNRGIGKYGKITFMWFQFGLEKKLLFQNNQLSAVTFGNIIAAGCRVGEYDWVNQFIDKHNKYLKASIRKEETLYSRAMMYYYGKQYELVVDEISDYSFSDSYKLKTRNILIRTYFELFLLDQDYFFVLMNTLGTFENYLFKNKIFKKDRIQPYYNLIRILKGITKRIVRKQNPELIKNWLKKQLDSNNNISGKQWLTGKFQLDKMKPNSE